MTVLDTILLVLFAVVVIIETIRGFGSAAFDLIALYSALLTTNAVFPSILSNLPPLFASGGTDTVLYIAVFVLITAAFLTASVYAAQHVRLNFGMFDRFAALIAAAAVAVVFCHAVVRGMSTGGSDQVAATNGSISQQVLTFSTYHQVVDHLYSLTGPSSNNS